MTSLLIFIYVVYALGQGTMITAFDDNDPSLKDIFLFSLVAPLVTWCGFLYVVILVYRKVLKYL